MKKAIVLLSGGLDSATVLYEARRRGYRPLCLIFDYGQRHRKEIRQAVRIARHGRFPYRLIPMALPRTGSALLDKTRRLPQNRHNFSARIPSTYVPARNLIFLSFAAAHAEITGAEAVFIGANAIDYSGYPDCRPEFFRALQRTFRTGLKTGTQGRSIRIITPLIRKTKAQIIRMGLRLKVPYHLTWSCYRGGRRPCGKCDSCLLRKKGFDEAGMEDPLLRRKEGRKREKEKAKAKKSRQKA